MVKSRIDKTINYPESMNLEEADVSLAASLWDLDIFGMPVLIALGHLKEEKDIGYFPIYIIINDSFHSQIGIYEFEYRKFDDCMDDDGDPILKKCGKPLFYKFVKKKYIKDLMAKQKKPAPPAGKEDFLPDDDTDEEDDKEDDDGDVLSDEKASVLPDSGDVLPAAGNVVLPGDGDSLPDSPNVLDYEKATGRFCDNNEEDDDDALETDDDHRREKAKYSKSQKRNWVQEWTKRHEFGLIGTVPNGDCFFEAIQKALETLGITVTIDDLREKLADELTDTQLRTFKELGYDIFAADIRKNKAKRRANKKEAREMKETYAQAKGDIEGTARNSQLMRELAVASRAIAEENKRLLSEIEGANQLMEEFAWMKGVITIDDMKAKIQTQDYWAEDWGVSKMEKILNVKFIILDEHNWNNKDYANLLLCAQRDITLKKFNPKYYIILNRTGNNHYELIEWKGKSMLTFKDIPCILRNEIVNKCLERNSGLFYMIPKFAKLKEGSVVARKEPLMGEPDATVSFSEDTVFQFYSKSADARPGKGSGEKILSSDTKAQKYKTLNKIKDWRKILSNFAEAPFKLDSLTWNGVEWYYQGSKFIKDNPNFTREFSVDSESEISKDPMIAKIAGGEKGFKYQKVTITDDETGKVSEKREKITYRDNDILVDPDFFPTNRNKMEMEKALRAKFTQNVTAREVLLATCGDIPGVPAKLQHYIRGNEPEVWYSLMKIRKELKDGADRGDDNSSAAAAAAAAAAADVPTAESSSNERSVQESSVDKSAGGTQKFSWKRGGYE